MVNPSLPAAAVQRGRFPQKYKVLISVIFGIFMVLLDTTVVNVAFPTLRTEYAASLNDAQWIISIYVLSIGISTPLAGYLADRFGMKQVYLSGLFFFIVGSLLCGIAPSLTFLIAARTLQGLGGGIALPLGFAQLMRAFPAEEQGTALGIFGIAVLVAPALGPILGGLLVDHSLWRFIFFINPPIGALGIFLGSRFLPNLKTDRRPVMDGLGLVTEVIGFGAMLYATSIAATFGWTSPGVLVWLGVGVAGLIAFTVVELFIAKEPLLDLRLFANRTFLNASLLGYVSVVALMGAEFLMPIYLQALRGKTAFETGLILLPMAASGAVATIVAGRLYDKIGPRLLSVFGFSVLMVNTWQLAHIQGETPVSWIMFLLTLRGLALGSTVQTTFVTALSVVPLMQLARGSSLNNATRQVMQSIGVAVLATVLASTLSPSISALQTKFQELPVQQSAPPLAICSPNAGALSAINTFASVLSSSGGLAPFGTQTDAGQPASNPLAFQQVLAQACQENIAGFEKAYTITFYGAALAVILGIMLPGWPFKWAGRRAADAAPTMGD